MKKEDYEKQIQELNEQAQRLEKTMQTYRDLERVKEMGHPLEAIITSSGFGMIDSIKIVCHHSGANYLIEPKTPMQMEIPNDPSVYGDLAGKKLKDIEIEVTTLPQEESEPAEKPTVPLEEEERTTGKGTYKVDVSGFLGKGV